MCGALIYNKDVNNVSCCPLSSHSINVVGISVYCCQILINESLIWWGIIHCENTINLDKTCWTDWFISTHNSILAGNAFRIHTSGSVTIAAGNQIITIRLYGVPASTILLSSYAITLATLTGSPPPYNLQTMCTYKSVGSTGSVQINSVFTVNDASPNQTFVNQSLGTIDTTVDNVFRMTA